LPRVKICGLMDSSRARTAARFGAGLLGLVFAPSRRMVTLEQAQEISGAVMSLLDTAGARPLLVGVFVNQPQDEVNRAAEACGLDYIQLSGDEVPDYCRGLDRPFIKALRLATEDDAEDMMRLMDSYSAVNPDAIFLLDTHLPGVYGGSGRPWEWERAVRLARFYPTIIAGGLTPENVAQAVREVTPWGVDVSSGVETDGVKDEAKIKAFIEAVRAVSLARRC